MTALAYVAVFGAALVAVVVVALRASAQRHEPRSTSRRRGNDADVAYSVEEMIDIARQREAAPAPVGWGFTRSDVAKEVHP